MCVLCRVVFDYNYNGSKGFDDGGYVVIGRLAIDCGEYFRGLFEEEGDIFGRQHSDHGGVVSFFVYLNISKL